MTTTINRPPRPAPEPGIRRRTTGPGAPRMDPRIRQRRTEVLRRQGRRRLRVLLGVCAVLGVALLGVLGLRSPWLSVRAIRVTGESGPQAAEVERVAALALHHPMVSVDLGLVVARVEALAWVDQARVRRSWPDTLDLAVTQRTPVAQVEVDGTWAQVDATARVVSVGRTQTAQEPLILGLPLAAGPVRPGSTLAPTAGSDLAVAAAVPSDLRAQVVSIGPDSTGGVALVLTDGARVDLGRPSALATKMAALETVMGEVDMTGVHTVDLRVPEQPALTRS
ncbi:MAG TPA: FtsQ-type POTRA domain-containing protein [Acidimicrobiales bacterium]|nr:FtsQ-type POTRA domain-containing protein [Acidimicrobiales bacterium]